MLRGLRVQPCAACACNPARLAWATLRGLRGRRCADFQRAKTDTEVRIRRLCVKLDGIRKFLSSSLDRAKSGESAAMEAVIKERLVEHTKKLTAATCDYRGLTRFWDKDFVEQLFEQPDKCGAILSTYQRMIVSMTKRAAA